MKIIDENNMSTLHPSFYLTSIYDYSVYEAFSKVFQKLVSKCSTACALLDSFITVRSLS